MTGTRYDTDTTGFSVTARRGRVFVIPVGDGDPGMSPEHAYRLALALLDAANRAEFGDDQEALPGVWPDGERE